MAGEDFLKHTQKAQLASKQLTYHYLNENGLNELEILLALLFQEKHVKHSPMMVQVASLLLIFLKPSEVFHVLSKLVESSQEAFKSEDQVALIRWHFTYEKGQYFKLLSTFVKSYLNTTVRKKRSVLLHMNKIGFDFSKFVDNSFKSMLGQFVSLPVALDILMMFMIEGVKIIFRYTYAILKVHKAYVKKSVNAQEFLDGLQKVGREQTDPKLLNKAAFKYPLKRSKYDFKKATAQTFKDPKAQQEATTELLDYMPNVKLNSNIVQYDEFAKIWQMMPDYVKIRVPELLYASTSDGFNLQNLYRKYAPFKHEYKFSLVLVQTTQNQVFGAFFDEVFKKTPKGYIGSSESFVFTLKPEVKCFYDAGVNTKYFLGDPEYFTIGGEG